MRKVVAGGLVELAPPAEAPPAPAAGAGAGVEAGGEAGGEGGVQRPTGAAAAAALSGDAAVLPGGGAWRPTEWGRWTWSSPYLTNLSININHLMIQAEE